MPEVVEPLDHHSENGPRSGSSSVQPVALNRKPGVPEKTARIVSDGTDAVKRTEAQIAAEEKAERDRRIFSLLNQLPINLSAERMIDERYANAPKGGLHIIRLLICVADDEATWLADRESVLADLWRLSQMSVEDAEIFMSRLNRELDADADAEDFACDFGDFMVDVMSTVYQCLPIGLQEEMLAIGDNHPRWL